MLEPGGQQSQIADVLPHRRPMARALNLVGAALMLSVDTMGHMADWFTQFRSMGGQSGALHAMRTAEKYHNSRYADAVTWDVERRTIPSDWMDASHTRWFNAMFDQFLGAIASGDYAGKEAQDAYHCLEIITTAYRSAGEGCRELPLGAPAMRDGPP